MNAPDIERAMTELSALDAEVLQAFRSRTYLNDAGSEHLLQFVGCPSLSDWFCWDFFKSSSNCDGGKFTVSETRWHRTEDIRVLQHPVERQKHSQRFVASVVARFLVVDEAMTGRWLEQLSDIRLPLSASSSGIVLDGVHYELELNSDGRARCRIQWESVIPTEWASIEPIIAEMTSVLDEAPTFE